MFWREMFQHLLDGLSQNLVNTHIPLTERMRSQMAAKSEGLRDMVRSLDIQKKLGAEPLFLCTKGNHLKWFRFSGHVQLPFKCLGVSTGLPCQISYRIHFHS